MIGKFKENTRKVVVVGAGISGLWTAYCLQKKGFEVRVLEKSSKEGGLIQGQVRTYGLIESGPDSIFGTENVFRSLALNVGGLEVSKKGLKRKIFTASGFSSPLKKISLFKTLGNLSKTHVKLSDSPTVFDFFSSLIGRKETDEVVSTGLLGIHSVTSHEIDFRSLFPTYLGKTYFDFFLHILKTKKKKKSFSFKNGMSTLPRVLKNKLDRSIDFNCSLGSLSEVEEDENLIICTDAHSAAEIRPSYLSKFEKIHYSALRVINFFTKEPISTLKNHFGVLYQKELNLPFLGVRCNTEIYPNRPPDSAPSYTLITDDLEKDAKEVIVKWADLHQLDMTVISVDQNIWNKAIPKYNKERREIINEVKNQLPPGLLINGNYIDGIGLGHILESTENFIETFATKN